MKYYYYFDEGASGIITTKTENLEKVAYEVVDDFCKNREYPVTLYGEGTIGRIGRFRVMIDKVIVSVEEIKKKTS